MGGDEGRGTQDADLSARLRRLDQRLDEVRGPEPAAAPPRADGASGGASSIGRAMRLSTEFVAGVIAGGGLGWVVDRVFGTSPWGLIVLLMLGFGAGILNVMRAAGFLGRAKPPGA